MRTPGLILAACLSLLSAAFVTAKEPFEYEVGDTVEADIVAPAAFRVGVVPDATALRQEARQKFPAVFRFDTNAAAEVERDFRAAFVAVRNNFFDVMASVYQRRRLNTQWLDSHRFEVLSATFRRQYREVPQLTNLVELWATGKSDHELQSVHVAQLREAMRQRIRPDDLPDELQSGSQVRLVGDPGVLPASATPESEATLVALADLLPLHQVRADFQKRFDSGDEVAAKYLARFLKPNWLPDAAATWQARESYVHDRLSENQYAAGQVVAHRGQQVDAKLLAALEQIEAMHPPPSGLPAKPDVPPAVPLLYRLDPWLWVGLGFAVAAFVLGAWQLLNRRQPVSLLPARVAGSGAPAGIISCPSCEHKIVIPMEALQNLSAHDQAWQQRALAAERRAEQAQAAIRAGVLPQFADWLKQRFVRGLVSERSQMLDAQKSATAELTELERRLDELHTPLQERLCAYEKRIAELEKLLAAKGEENRELLKARIQMTRQQLETTRSRNPLEFN